MSPCSVPEKSENIYFQCYAYCNSLSAKLPSQGETDFVEEFIFNLNPQTLSKILKGGSEGPKKKPKRQERSSYINRNTPDYLPCYADECEEKCGRNKVASLLYFRNTSAADGQLSLSCSGSKWSTDC